MKPGQSLSMLALRRSSVAAEALSQGGDGPANVEPALRWPSSKVLADSLPRAVDRVWITLELILARGSIAIRLGSQGQKSLEALVDAGCFSGLRSMPAPFRDPLARELHRARKSGPLAPTEIDPAELIRHLSFLGPVSDARALQDLEWYALWQLAEDVARLGAPALKSLFEFRTERGESLLVGLLAAFAAYNVESLGEAWSSPGSILEPEHVRWLAQNSERLEALLDEEYGDGPAPARDADEGAAVRHLRQGQALAQRGEYDRAIVEYTAAIRADEGFADAFVLRADVHRLQGDFERAVADYSQAVRIDPGHTKAYVHRSLTHRLRGDFDQAVADADEAIRLEPASSSAFSHRAAALAQRGEYDRAIDDFTAALRIDANLTWAYQGRGDAHAGKGQHDQAIADYSEALRLNPHLPLAFVNRGDVYRQKSEFPRAIADYTEALNLDPVNPRIFTSRGETLRLMGKLDQALVDLTEAIRLDATNPAVYLNRGMTYQLLRQFDHAVADFNRAEQFDSANPELYYQRAMAYRSTAKYRRAEADLTRVIELNPRDAVAYLNRGMLASARGRLDDAVDDLSEAIALDPGSAQARLERGRVFAMSGAFEPALADLEEAIRLNGQLAPARIIRGGVLVRQERFEDAVAEFTEAITINPRYAKAYNDRGVALSKLGRFDDAIADFGKAAQINPDYAQSLANRGNAQQILGRHDQALRDFTKAVLLDDKYAAQYCVQRALADLAHHQYESALAELSVALKLDPENVQAKNWFDHVREQREQNFDLQAALTNMAAPVEASPSQPVRERPANSSSPATLLEEPATTPDADAEPPVDLSAATITEEAPAITEDDRKEYEAEQQRLKLLERMKEDSQGSQMRMAMMEAAKAEEDSRKKREEAKKKQKKSWQYDPDDEEDRAERRRKIRLYGIVAVGSLVAAYYILPMIWSLVPNSKNPYGEVEAAKLVAEFARDPAKAEERFSDRVVVVRGKLKVIKVKVGRGQLPPPPKIFFEVGEQEKVSVECQFDDTDVANDLREDVEYRVAGRVQKFKPGSPITLKQATIMGGGKATAKASARQLKPPALAANTPWFHRILTMRSPVVHARTLKPFTVPAASAG